MNAFFRLISAVLATGTFLVSTGFSLNNAIIPESEILTGGPPKDGIPALLAPHFAAAEKADLKADDQVIGVVIEGEAHAYPVKILTWHEAVNDEIQGQPILVTF